MTKARKKQKHKFEERDIQVLRENDFRGGKIKLRLVRWCIDGKSTKLKLEKRMYRKIKNTNTWFTGKLQGMTKEDLSYIHANYHDIYEMFD